MASNVTFEGKLAFPSDYLAAAELQGKDWTLTVSAVSMDELRNTDGTTKKGLVLRFRETKKKLIVNKTVGKKIAGMYGWEAKGWAGKRITVFPTTCQAFGETVPCIRVRASVESAGGPPSQPAAAPSAPPDPESLPFADAPEATAAGDGLGTAFPDDPLAVEAQNETTMIEAEIAACKRSTHVQRVLQHIDEAEQLIGVGEAKRLRDLAKAHELTLVPKK